MNGRDGLRRRSRFHWEGWLLAGVPALYLAALFLLPMAWVLASGLIGPDGELTVERYVAAARDPYIQRLIARTAEQALFSAGLSVLIGVPLAHILVNRSFPGRRLVTGLTLVPFVLPPVTVALGFLLTFGVNGWFNQVLDALLGTRIRLLYTLPAIALAHAFYNAPVVARMTQAAWERLDPSLEESARLLGASPARVFWDVTAPAILPGVASGAALAFIYSFMSFPIVLALGGARYSTLEVEIYTQVRVLLDYETGAALAAIQAAISLVFARLFLRLEGSEARIPGAGVPRPVKPLFAFRPRAVIEGAFLVAAGVLFLGPVLAVVADSLSGPEGVSLSGYRRIFALQHDARLETGPLASILTSLRIGAWASLIATGTGLLFVLGLLRIKGRWRALLETLGMAPMVVSSVALGYGVILAARHWPLAALESDWRIVCIHSVLAFPLVVRACRPAFDSLDPRLVEAARTLGSSRFAAFLRVELPLSATALLVALALAFGLSLSEMSATMMLARPGLITMPVSVYRFLSARDFQGASAMAVVLIAAAATLFAGIEFVGGRLWRKSGGRSV